MTVPKNILTSAPFLAGDFVEKSNIKFDVEKYQHFINMHKHKLGAFGKYLICKLHDSWVTDIDISDNLFSVTLNDFSTHVFADALIEKKNLNIDHDELVFPIQIDFKTNGKVTFNKVDDDGILTEVDPVKLDEYLYEQVVSIDNNKIELAFTFWQSFQDDKPGQRFVLLVTATDIIISERQDLAWQKIFGNRWNDHYSYFKQEFDSDRYVSDQYQCLKLIDEFELTKN